MNQISKLLGAIGLTKQLYDYQHGEVGEIEWVHKGGSVSWIKRCFWADRYIYYVAIEEVGEHPTYMIARSEKTIRFFTHEESLSLPDGRSGVLSNSTDHRVQRHNEQQLLTRYGYWLARPPSDYFYEGDTGPFRLSGPIPTEVIRFNSEDVAYQYMERVSGRQIPAPVTHLAWLVIGLSTFLWQSTSWGPTLYDFLVDLF